MIIPFQLLCALAWLVPTLLLVPSVWRVLRAPMYGPSRADPIDVVLSPLAFVGALQIGQIVRWFIYPEALRYMHSPELVVWAGLYTLSTLTALCSVFAWYFCRRL
jgi:hypothetical protein